MSIVVGKTGTVRCYGEHLTKLRMACMVRDEFICQECGRYTNPSAPEWADSRSHMAHIIGVGAGGSDVLSNVRCLCGGCHIGKEHAYGKSMTKPCPKKEYVQ